MNRADRRKEEKAKKKLEQEQKIQAARQFERDIKRDGIFDASAAMNSPHYMAQVVKQRMTEMAGWERNGITKDDLKAEYDKGYAAARKDLTTFFMRMFYCAIAISLRRLFRFGEGRILRVLDAVQWTMTEEICTADITKRCKEETGIDIFDTDYDN